MKERQNWFPITALLLLLGLGGGEAQEGYRLLPDQVVVNSAAHWQAWTAPEGSRVITVLQPQ